MKLIDGRKRERKRTLRGPWRQEEKIFVFVNLKHDSERLIRRGFRIAYRLKAEWYVVYVKDHPLSGEEQQQIDKLRTLAERLGGIFEMYEALDRRHVFKVLVEEMNKKSATQVIIGQSARTRWKEVTKGSVVQRLLKRASITTVKGLISGKPSLANSSEKRKWHENSCNDC